ncbi:30S ribosomal protein S11 [Candidatus Vidania fulgoroideae]|uniref:Small ribosomal subunit protein uS11 n=1 Tax=Candidatus Vidania fulgoroideorum TaxID=881286 RepID=A0A975AEJ6_9PROT|nr:30S ribosomal protein S11 [Candidatus Vidania fulgoroideae]
MISRLILHVLCTHNNTILSLTNYKGMILDWCSSGRSGFKCAKKSSTYAYQISTERICRKITSLGFKSIDVKIKGLGSGRDIVTRTILNMGISISSLSDITPTPHNGCRPKKKRRT